MSQASERAAAFRQFRWNENVIAVRNEEEYYRFSEFLKEFSDKLADDFARRTKSYSELCYIIRLNYSDPSCIMFEVKDAGEYGLSITFSCAEDYDHNCDYYGEPPWEMSEL